MSRVVAGSPWEYPGLAVTHGKRGYFLDRSAQVVLLVTCRQFSVELGSVDLSFFDPDIRPGGP
ncbi:protein of unknown function [Methylorubrum extorquens]|uniref:Uncharacterized protein n=1 Tax=Methylorubrum extorquens TaxID=408 RepID=A0A2N9AXM7_METEX|nr:protein of unknown function [Methylorubrum extorquens]